MKFRSRKKQTIDEARRIHHLAEIERLRARGDVPSAVADLVESYFSTRMGAGRAEKDGVEISVSVRPAQLGNCCLCLRSDKYHHVRLFAIEIEHPSQDRQFVMCDECVKKIMEGVLNLTEASSAKESAD